MDWLLERTSLVGVGVDTLSIELGHSQQCYVHRTLTSHNKVRGDCTVYSVQCTVYCVLCTVHQQHSQYGVECVANMARLPARDFTVTVLPLKIEGGSGGPCRVIARLPGSCH